MIKKEYVSPEMETIEMELEDSLLTISTDTENEYGAGDVEDL